MDTAHVEDAGLFLRLAQELRAFQVEARAGVEVSGRYVEQVRQAWDQMREDWLRATQRAEAAMREAEADLRMAQNEVDHVRAGIQAPDRSGRNRQEARSQIQCATEALMEAQNVWQQLRERQTRFFVYHSATMERLEAHGQRTRAFLGKVEEKLAGALRHLSDKDVQVQDYLNAKRISC